MKDGESMPIRLWPADYERKDHITSAEKFLLRNASRTFSNGHFVIGIDPLGMSTADVHMGMYITPSEGLITFSIYNDRIDASKLSAYKSYVDYIEDKMYDRLLDSKILIVRENDIKCLKFPYKHLILFPNEKINKKNSEKDNYSELLGYAAIEFFRPVTSDGNEKHISELGIFSDIRKPYDKDFSILSDLECRAIFERLAPEYTVVMNEIENVVIKETTAHLSEEDFKISGNELEYKTFFLDEYQVAQVNDMGKGHRVILANPGAGKSVLLLSKAFKYASMFKESKVLLTCYNSNLADSYRFKKACADFGDNKNLFIMTFHKLVNEIYRQCLHKRCSSPYATDEEIQSCIDMVKGGKLNLRFKAIFIDEVQIFNPLYLELCYYLLDKDDADQVFLMAGDLNQAVRKLSRRGDAPWKHINGVNLDFTGRVRYIEKNYRNSKEIAEYISDMLKHINNRLSMLDLINSMEYEYNSFKIGEKPSVALKVKTGINRMDIQKELGAAIKEIVSTYDISYSDIAIIFPYKQHASVKYYFLYWTEKLLNQEDIPYSMIITSDKATYERKKYSQTSGVVLTTIDSSLGLDFKAVILAGLYPYSFVFGDKGYKKEISSWSAIKKMDDNDQTQVQSQMRSVYTACSRARDILYVLSDINPDTPMEEILKK